MKKTIKDILMQYRWECLRSDTDIITRTTQVTQELLELVLAKLPEKEEHICLLKKPNLEECRTVKDWVKFGYNQAIDETEAKIRELMK